MSIATAAANSVDCQMWLVSSPIISFPASFPICVLVKRLDGLLQLADVVERKLSSFGELRHHGLGTTSEKTQDLIKQTVSRDIAGDERLKDIGIADLPD